MTLHRRSRRRDSTPAQSPRESEGHARGEARRVRGGARTAAARSPRPAIRKRRTPSAKCSPTARRGVTVDVAEAVAWFRKAAMQGFGAGQVNLRIDARTRTGRRARTKRKRRAGIAAPRWRDSRKASTISRGLCRPARACRSISVRRCSWAYAKAVNQNFAPSQFTYGLMHRDGIGVTRNPAEAIRLFRRAARRA